jgi:DNA modification methylase
VKLFNDDCLKVLPTLPDKSIDLILTDPPYGTTQCKWDSIIPFELMWNQLKRVIKDNGCIALFGSEPFSSALRMSNIEWFKYDWYWNKKIPSGMCNAKIMPMRQIELISIFINGNNFYYPQMITREIPIKSGGMSGSLSAGAKGLKKINTKTYNYKCPINLIQFDKIRRGSFHPTQKPVALLEYLIKTYTNENDTVLDFTMGSGSTGVACKNLNRDFIGIELDQEYFKIAKERIESTNPLLI